MGGAEQCGLVRIHLAAYSSTVMWAGSDPVTALARVTVTQSWACGRVGKVST